MAPPFRRNQFLAANSRRAAGDGGTVCLMVTNALGQTTNASVTLTVLSGPAVAAQTAAGPHALFWNFCLSAGCVSGAQPMGFQWYQNGVRLTNDGRISGATSPTLGFNVAEYQDNGNYTLMVTTLLAALPVWWQT